MVSLRFLAQHKISGWWSKAFVNKSISFIYYLQCTLNCIYFGKHHNANMHEQRCVWLKIQVEWFDEGELCKSRWSKSNCIYGCKLYVHLQSIGTWRQFKKKHHLQIRPITDRTSEIMHWSKPLLKTKITITWTTECLCVLCDYLTLFTVNVGKNILQIGCLRKVVFLTKASRASNQLLLTLSRRVQRRRTGCSLLNVWHVNDSGDLVKARTCVFINK